MAGAEYGYDIHLLGLTQENYDRLQKLKELAKADSMRDTLWEAALLYEWYLTQKAAGEKLFRIVDGAPVELEFEFTRTPRLRLV